MKCPNVKSYSFGKSTSTIDKYNLSCTKTPNVTIDSYSLSCLETVENKASYGGSNYISTKVTTLQNSINNISLLNSRNGKVKLTSK